MRAYLRSRPTTTLPPVLAAPPVATRTTSSAEAIRRSGGRFIYAPKEVSD